MLKLQRQLRPKGLKLKIKYAALFFKSKEIEFPPFIFLINLSLALTQPSLQQQPASITMDWGGLPPNQNIH